MYSVTRTVRSAVAGLLVACFVLPLICHGQQSDHGVQVDYELGFGGEFKRGVWIPVQATVMNDGVADFHGQLVVEAEDVDGIPVSYSRLENQFTVAAGASITVSQLIKVGRLPWRVEVGIRNRTTGDLVDQKLFDQSAGGNRKATSYFVLQLGKGLPISRSRLQSSITADPDLVEVSLIQYDDYENLPSEWIGYESIDLMVMPTAASGILDRLSDAQTQALKDWVFQGGRLILFAGSEAVRLGADDSPLAQLIPGEITGAVAQWNTSGLESYGNAQQRLFLEAGKNPLAQLNVTDGRVILRDQENAQALHPLIVRSVRGFGMVVFVAFDIDIPPFDEWNSSARVLEKLIAIGRNAGEEDDSLSGGGGNHAGYQDISGQLRSQLEKFESVTPIQFVWIAALLALFVLVIGPLDYYLLRKLDRFHWTWVTFPGAVVVIALIVVVMTNTLPADSPQMNQLHIVDIDASTGTVRGTDYLALYSPQVAAFDVRLDKITREADLSTLPAIERDFVTTGWHGLPGTGLGALGRTSFQTYINHKYLVDGATVELRQIPVQHGGTKSIQSRWSGQMDVGIQPDLHADPISGALRGTLTNPFEFDLYEAEIVFDGKVYPIGRTFTAGAKVDVFDISDQSQGIDNYYSKYQDGSSRGDRRRWSVMEESIQRIVRQMMFNQSIGGAKYTGLIHRYEEFLDLSHALAYNRAVLVARAGQSNNGYVVNGEHDVVLESENNFYRVVFKVKAAP